MNTIKLQRKTSGKLKDIGIGKDLEKLLEAKRLKAKLCRWNCMKLKIFCITKEALSNGKRQPTEAEEIFAMIQQ